MSKQKYSILEKTPYDVLVEEKLPDSYTKNVKKNIKIISYNPDAINVYGSYKYRSQPFPGDIDISEEIIACCNSEEAKKKVPKYLSNIVKRIIRTKGNFIGDVKAGINKMFVIPHGYKKGRAIYEFNTTKFLEDIEELYGLKMLDKKQYDKLKSYAVIGISVDLWRELDEEIRLLYVLRWTVPEIVKGEKQLPGGLVMKWEDAVMQPYVAYYGNYINNSVKIDMWAPVGGRYIEVTNFFFIYEQDNKGKIKWVNIDKDYYNKLADSLRGEVEKYYSKQFYKPFKMAKRMYSLARIEKINGHDVRNLVKLFRSDVGKINQVISDIDTAITMTEKVDKLPMAYLMNEIDEFRQRLSSVIDVDIDSETVNKPIERLLNNNKHTRKDMIDVLTKIMKYLKSLVQKATEEYLHSIGLLPPPFYYLPQ